MIATIVVCPGSLTHWTCLIATPHFESWKGWSRYCVHPVSSKYTWNTSEVQMSLIKLIAHTCFSLHDMYSLCFIRLLVSNLATLMQPLEIRVLHTEHVPIYWWGHSQLNIAIILTGCLFHLTFLPYIFETGSCYFPVSSFSSAWHYTLDSNFFFAVLKTVVARGRTAYLLVLAFVWRNDCQCVMLSS